MPMDGHNSSIACYDVDTDGGEEKQAIEDLDDGGNNDTPSIIGGVPHHFVSDGRLLAGNVRKLDVDSTRDILSSQTWSWDEPLMMGMCTFILCRYFLYSISLSFHLPPQHLIS